MNLKKIKVRAEFWEMSYEMKLWRFNGKAGILVKQGLSKQEYVVFSSCFLIYAPFIFPNPLRLKNLLHPCEMFHVKSPFQRLQPMQYVFPFGNVIVCEFPGNYGNRPEERILEDRTFTKLRDLIDCLGGEVSGVKRMPRICILVAPLARGSDKINSR
ncbi:hypothetical protein N7510_003234 [Penicillium lagena]|uniref:uncharacterized protein n=1 Tax=Penicillium lagena TaxID=94218 RepID=UPI00254020FC|nr:uncharacterized protein N7510_003234 [Penicillium lagena]KAJ5619250.1 hypothetical protein N7510_003234 [Penicillium lagena]